MHDFFNTHPILPIFSIFVNITSLFPVLFLIILVQKASFHCNYRYLFNAWLGGYFALFSANICISWLALAGRQGFLPQSKRSSPYREIFYGLCASSSLYCSISEIALAVERIYSTTHPEEYHKMTLAKYTLVSWTGFLIPFSLLIGRLEFQYNLVSAGGIFVMLCDIMTVTTNTISVKFNRMRYNAEIDNLNAKYQVKEAFKLALAMQLVYIVIFCVKCFIISFSMVCLQMENAYFIGYNEALYTTVSALNASIVSIMLIKKHPQLKKHARLLLGIPNAIEPRQQNYSHFTQDHFKSLETYWS